MALFLFYFYLSTSPLPVSVVVIPAFLAKVSCGPDAEELARGHKDSIPQLQHAVRKSANLVVWCVDEEAYFPFVTSPRPDIAQLVWSEQREQKTVFLMSAGGLLTRWDNVCWWWKTLRRWILHNVEQQQQH